jgi:hypothetical protein
MSLSPSRVSSGGSGPTRPESSSTSVAVGTSTPVRARVPATSGSSNYSSPQRCLQFDAVPHPDALYVDGINIYYPENKKPFDPQRKLSECIIRALKNKQNALLESPTGTGKTLPCSVRHSRGCGTQDYRHLTLQVMAKATKRPRYSIAPELIRS